jgi:hypothetical protein
MSMMGCRPWASSIVVCEPFSDDLVEWYAFIATEKRESFSDGSAGKKLS